MRKVTVTLVYDSPARLNPGEQAIGKALQDLYVAAHFYSGVSYEVAQAHWTEEHIDKVDVPDE